MLEPNLRPQDPRQDVDSDFQCHTNLEDFQCRTLLPFPTCVLQGVFATSNGVAWWTSVNGMMTSTLLFGHALNSIARHLLSCQIENWQDLPFSCCGETLLRRRCFLFVVLSPG